MARSVTDPTQQVRSACQYAYADAPCSPDDESPVPHIPGVEAVVAAAARQQPIRATCTAQPLTNRTGPVAGGVGVEVAPVFFHNAAQRTRPRAARATPPRRSRRREPGYLAVRLVRAERASTRASTRIPRRRAPLPGPAGGVDELQADARAIIPRPGAPSRALPYRSCLIMPTAAMCVASLVYVAPDTSHFGLCAASARCRSVGAALL